MAGLPYARPEEIRIDAQRLDVAYKLLTSWTTGENAPVPSGAIVVGRNGRIVEPRFFGRQGPERGAEAIRRDAIFLVASITKPITCTAAMLLVERGELSLTDPVTRYIPEFAAHHKEDTLVAHLFTHTSGMPDMLENNVELRRRHAPLADFIRGAIRDTVPLFRPGTDLRYQSMGTLVVAEIIQRLSGKPIDAFLHEEIFAPLGLASMALGSKRLERARLVRVQTPEYQAASDFGWNSSFWQELGAPWGGLFGAPEDFAVLCQLFLNYGHYNNVRILSPAAVRMMTTNRLNDFPDLPESIRRTQPWGLGWRMNHPGRPGSWGDLLDRTVYGHTGATGTMMWIHPQANAFCILFTSAIAATHGWRRVRLSNAVAAAMM